MFCICQNMIVWMKFADRFCDRSSDQAKPDKTNGFMMFDILSKLNYAFILKEYTINVK